MQQLIVIALATSGHHVQLSGTVREVNLLEDLYIEILYYRSAKRL